MSDDLLNQHAAISEIQQTEEIVVDQHKAINEFLAQFLTESRELYSMTNSIEYDQDGEFDNLRKSTKKLIGTISLSLPLSLSFIHVSHPHHLEM